MSAEPEGGGWGLLLLLIFLAAAAGGGGAAQPAYHPPAHQYVVPSCKGLAQVPGYTKCRK